ncbi:MAG: NusA N-terminal domain-containing protein [Metamycoplasmataceae bacterium]
MANNNWKIKELNEIFKHIEAKNNISVDTLNGLLLKAISYVINKEIDSDAEIELQNTEKNIIKIINTKKLIISDEEFKEEYEGDKLTSIYSIPFSKAKEINPNAKIGDTIAEEVFNEDFTPKINTLIQSAFKLEISKNQREKIYKEYSSKINQDVVAKFVSRETNGARFILEDGVECFLPMKYWNEAIPIEGSITKFIIEEVLEIPEKKYNYSQILVSNSSTKRLLELFSIEIPEIGSGFIEVVSISRIPGIHSKISFKQSPEYIGQLDILGCVIGPKGSRINAISEKLGGEKFDIVLFSEINEQYIANSLSPARVASVNKRTKNEDYLVVVPDRHSTLAIGKKGLNVKLAVELTKFNIDICSYSEAVENKIEILWNGNIDNVNELNIIEKQEGRVNRKPNLQTPNKKANSWFNKIDFEDYEKEIAEYQDEINNFKSDFKFESNMDFNLPKAQEIKTNNFKEKENQDTHEYSQKEMNKIKDNFTYDKDLLEGMDFDDIDFSEFEKEDEDNK